MNGSTALAALRVVAIGLIFGSLGWVIASDYRGFTAWHARTTIRFTHPLTRVPPWRWLPAHLKDPSSAYDRQYRLGRLMGWSFVIVGAVVVISGLVGLGRAAL